MKYIAILLFAPLAFACKRTVCTDYSSYPLTGKWKFTQYYMDPGNGSGTWQPAPANQTYIQFNSDGAMSSDVGMFGNYSKYEILKDSLLVLSAPGISNVFTMYYKITGSTLEINPLCFEGCGYQFKRQ